MKCSQTPTCGAAKDKRSIAERYTTKWMTEKKKSMCSTRTTWSEGVLEVGWIEWVQWVYMWNAHESLELKCVMECFQTNCLRIEFKFAYDKASHRGQCT